jgi:hypothetical protein
MALIQQIDLATPIRTWGVVSGSSIMITFNALQLSMLGSWSSIGEERRAESFDSACTGFRSPSVGCISSSPRALGIVNIWRGARWRRSYLAHNSAPAFPSRARPLAPRLLGRARIPGGATTPRPGWTPSHSPRLPSPLLSRQFTCSGFLLGPQICRPRPSANDRSVTVILRYPK